MCVSVCSVGVRVCLYVCVCNFLCVCVCVCVSVCLLFAFQKFCVFV